MRRCAATVRAHRPATTDLAMQEDGPESSRLGTGGQEGVWVATLRRARAAAQHAKIVLEGNGVKDVASVRKLAAVPLFVALNTSRAEGPKRHACAGLIQGSIATPKGTVHWTVQKFVTDLVI
jgi:hypothetical protein